MQEIKMKFYLYKEGQTFATYKDGKYNGTFYLPHVLLKGQPLPQDLEITVQEVRDEKE